MKYETPMMDIMKLDYVFTIDTSGTGESTGGNEDNDDVGGWVPGSK